MLALEYLKYTTTMVSRIKAGMRKYILIWHILTIAMIMIKGPSTESQREKMMLVSMMPKSVENLLVSIPEGLLSKNVAGLRIIESIILSCTVILELISTMFKA